MLQKFGKTMDSFLVGADPNAKGAVRFFAQWEQRRAHGAHPPRRSPRMSWSMLAAKPRNKGKTLLGKIPRLVNRVSRPRGRRPVLTEQGCAAREAFQTVMQECLHARRNELQASPSGKPLTADELSSLIRKCDAFYDRDFPATVNTLLRKFVREKNRSIVSVFSDAHRQIFEKAVAAMKPELAGGDRDAAACHDMMWELFSSANERADPYLEKLARSLHGAKKYPKLTEYGCALRDRFNAAAIVVIHAEQADALAKSDASKAAAMKIISPLNRIFEKFYSSFFREEVDALLGEYASGAKDLPLEKLFWFAHRAAFRNAVDATDSHCVEAAWKLYKANLPHLPDAPTGGARHLAKGWSKYTVLMHECRARIAARLKSHMREIVLDELDAAAKTRLTAKTPPIMQAPLKTARSEREILGLVVTREMSTQTSATDETVSTEETGRQKLLWLTHRKTIGIQTSAELSGRAQPAQLQPGIDETADYSGEYMKRFEAFLKARPDIYDKVLARRRHVFMDAAGRDAGTQRALAVFELNK